ncbi:tonsoku-like protein [Xylocopa sonorina]|uniref:tonsoku-like protein n=1 Tax=Xylocopa sonorina TaxID=1818115 RepID=UPI00403AEB16
MSTMDIDRLIKKKKRVKRDGNLQQLAEIAKELGDTYYEMDKYKEALREYTEQLEVCSILEDKLNIAVAHRMIGEMHVNLCSYEEALKHQNLYLAGAKEIANTLEKQRAYATLGRTYFCWAESLPEKSESRIDVLTSARKAYTKSIHLCNKLENTDITLKELITMRARLLLNLGLVLEAERKHQEAIDLMEKAADLFITHNLREDFFRTQIALGGVCDRNCDYDSALKYFDIAAETDSPLRTEALLFQAELLLKIERWRESRKILVSLYTRPSLPPNLKHQVERCLRIVATLHATEDALSIEESTDGTLKLYETLGDAAVAANCFEKAISYYRKMLECAEEINSDRIGAALLSLAQTLKDVGRYNEALDFARKEFELCTDPREICRSGLFLADLLITTKASNEKIEESYDIALKNAKACRDVFLEASVLKDRLNYLENSGRTEEVNALKEKLNALKELSTGTDSVSESDSEENNIGADICLDDLSDVEAELEFKKRCRSRKRTKNNTMAVKRNEKGETQLHVACINGNIEAVEKLLESGHTTNIRDHFGWTPLHEAANHGHIEIAKLLLKHGANIDDPGSLMCQGVTPLHDAASCGNFAMIRFLIEHGANVLLKTDEGDTVLDCLEQWRDRVDSLSSDDQAGYDEIHELLCDRIPADDRRNSKHSHKTPCSSKARNTEGNSTAKRISASEDYKRTIASLMHRSDPIGISLSRSKRNAKPLLNSEEMLSDDWLEDDINESFRNRCPDEQSTSMTKRKSSNDDVDPGKYLKRQKTSYQNPEVIDKEPAMVMEQDSNDSCNSEIMQVFKERKNQKRKQQMSLLSIGFSKSTISRTPSPATPSCVEPESEEIDATKSVILNISVDGKVFKTQVEFSNTMKPLVQDIVSDIESKFYNNCGCKVKLELRAMNGIAINSNNVFTILNEGDIIKNFVCEIIELDTPPIVERYGTICKNYNIDVRECTLKCLRTCENTFILRLKHDVKRMELISLLKTVEYQKNIQILDLSDSILYAIGDVLNDCILKLSTLQELCLQGCDINSNCLSNIEKFPPELKVLNLSYNPLGSTSKEILCKLLAPLTQLRTLNLRYCQLRTFPSVSNKNNLINLDVSDNKFNDGGLCTVVQRQLLNLNLSNTISSGFNFVKNIINKPNFSFINVECLELAFCELTDIDVENVLSHTSNLSRFLLRGNRNVGIRSLNMLLNYKPTLRYIDVSGCKDISEFPNSEVFIEKPEICTLIVSMDEKMCECWIELWRGEGIVKKLPHNLTVFKPVIEFGS